MGYGPVVFLYSDGVYTTIEPPGADYTMAPDINNSGQIVGSYLIGSGGFGFEYSGGIYKTLNVPGAAATGASSINNSGQIVGIYSSVNSATFGFEYSNGAYTTIAPPGVLISVEGSKINNVGQIIGYYTSLGTNGAPYEASYLYSNGIYIRRLTCQVQITPSRQELMTLARSLASRSME